MVTTNALASTLFDFGKQPLKYKADKKYGTLIAQSLLSGIKDNTSNYYVLRNARFTKNRLYAAGNQPMVPYLDLLNIDGKEAFTNIDLEPPAIAPKFMEILIGRYMERMERPTVRAVDEKSKQDKQREMDDAEFRMNNGELIQGLQQETGMQLEDPTAYTPENYDDLTLHFELEHRLPQEICFEVSIKNVIDDCGSEVQKRQLLSDLVKCGMAVAKVYKDANGKNKYKRIKPENAIYTWSNYDDFRDTALAGELVKKKITEAREEYPFVDEETWFRLFQATPQDSKVYLTWSEQYRESIYRPYDDALVELFDFELITTESKMYVEGKDRFNKPTLDEKKGRPMNLGSDKQLIDKKIKVVYQGVYACGCNEMIKWELARNMIKPHQALHEVFSSFAIIMPDNDDMYNKALIARVETAIRQMTIAHLKIQQLISKLRPDGLIIDISGLTDVDLGLGNTKTPLQLQAIYDQTGNLYYKRKGDDGDTVNDVPIQPTDNNNGVSKINTLIQVYNFYQNILRDYLGTNEYTEGQAVNPKLGLGVMENQVTASNRATEFVYSAYINLMEQVAKRLSVLMWYDVVYSDETYGGALSKDDVQDRVFDINISMLPTDQERNYIEGLVQTALSAGLITFEEAFKVRRYAKENVKLAEVYLSKYQRRRQQETMQQNQANIQAQGQEARASNQQTHDNALELKQMEFKGKGDVQKLANEGDINKNLGTFVTQMVLESFKMGKELPPYLAPIVQGYFQNVMGSQQIQTVENGQTMQDMQQQLAQQQMMQQQAAAQQTQDQPMQGAAAGAA